MEIEQKLIYEISRRLTLLKNKFKQTSVKVRLVASCYAPMSLFEKPELRNKLSRVGVGAAATYLVGAAATYLGWVAGSSGNKTNSAFNWVEVEAKAELGKSMFILFIWDVV